MNYEAESRYARETVATFRIRFKGRDDSFDPIHFAIEWQKVFEGSEPNLDLARRVVPLALEKKNSYDICFHGFCIHMEKVLHEMIEDSLIH